jgi:hypothetical protein
LDAQVEAALTGTPLPDNVPGAIAEVPVSVELQPHQVNLLNDITASGSTSEFSKVLHSAIDESTFVIIGELDKLSNEIEIMKSKIVKHGLDSKASITKHMDLGAEAARFATSIKTKLSTYINDAEQIHKDLSNGHAS